MLTSIMIKVPSEAHNQNMIGEGKPLKVRVEFSLEDPRVSATTFINLVSGH